MRRIGLIGGMSWESTAEYYRLLNTLVAQRLGGLHSADLLLASVDFAVVEQMQSQGRWDDAAALLVREARVLEAGGADFLVLCTNTMHKLADRVQAAVGIDLLHLADATAEAVVASGVRRVGLLGTRFTMEQDFYTDRLRGHGLDVVVPGDDDRRLVDTVIYDELCRGVVREQSRREYERVVAALVDEGCEAVVLGCTEIELLLDPSERPAGAPLFATTRLHCEAAVDRALAP